MSLETPSEQMFKERALRLWTVSSCCPSDRGQIEPGLRETRLGGAREMDAGGGWSGSRV